MQQVQHAHYFMRVDIGIARAYYCVCFHTGTLQQIVWYICTTKKKSKVTHLLNLSAQCSVLEGYSEVYLSHVIHCAICIRRIGLTYILALGSRTYMKDRQTINITWLT